jgi:hypothetical protein
MDAGRELMSKETQIATVGDWKAAAQAAREARAEPLRLPSGATIMAVKPEPLEWIMSGRIPQRLLAAALESHGSLPATASPEISREEILDLARFAAQLVQASVIRPAIGEGPDEIRLDDIPIEDRAFIFQWACRALGTATADNTPGGLGNRATNSTPEDISSPSGDGLERFRAQ